MVKTILQAITIAFALVIMFGAAKQTVSEQKAIVNNQEGISIFIMSTPVSEYEFLGTVKKTGLVWSGKPDEMFNGILKKCKKEFPLANGIIFSDISLERADCIKLK